jgi:hypothetical protein
VFQRAHGKREKGIEQITGTQLVYVCEHTPSNNVCKIIPHLKCSEYIFMVYLLGAAALNGEVIVTDKLEIMRKEALAHIFGY